MTRCGLTIWEERVASATGLLAAIALTSMGEPRSYGERLRSCCVVSSRKAGAHLTPVLNERLRNLGPQHRVHRQREHRSLGVEPCERGHNAHIRPLSRTRRRRGEDRSITLGRRETTLECSDDSRGVAVHVVANGEDRDTAIGDAQHVRDLWSREHGCDIHDAVRDLLEREYIVDLVRVWGSVVAGHGEEKVSECWPASKNVSQQTYRYRITEALDMAEG